MCWNLCFQLLSDSGSAELGLVVLVAQVCVAVAVSVGVVRRAKTELDSSINNTPEAGYGSFYNYSRPCM